jgi:glycerate 2-kinase
VSAELKQIASDIFRGALADCSVTQTFARKVRVEQKAGTNRLMVDGMRAARLDGVNRVRVLAAGKAAAAMLEGLLERVPFEGCDLRGVLIARERPDRLPHGFEFFVGGHPEPNAASFAGAHAALSLAEDAARYSDSTLCVFLISGGASSMMELPLDTAIGVEDAAGFHRALVRSGATITEMNCVRKHFSAVKGGRLALAAGGARKLSLLVSDVPPGQVDVLGSGPTVADSTAVKECRRIMRKYGLEGRFPGPVRRFFAGAIPETPKPGEIDCTAHVLLSSDDMADAAQRRAEALGFTVGIDNGCDDWPYTRAADYLLERARNLRMEYGRVCVISCGEVTVRLPEALSDDARGGRNQQWALYMATRLSADDAPVAALSAGSDGVDGNSVAAGAVVDEASAGAGSEEALRDFDAYTYLEARGATLVTGPTGQNLRDLRMVVMGA